MTSGEAAPSGHGSRRHWLAAVGVSVLTALAVQPAALADADDRAPLVPVNGRIGYVMTDLYWAMYQTRDGREECPQGYNDGPREQFEALYPSGSERSVIDTQLALEQETWFPSTEPDGFEFHEVEGPYARGLNLDGAIGDEDFTHPDGTPGIDNQVYRAVGCVIGYRGPDGVEYIFQNKAILDERYNRMMFELTGVDDLSNDDDVTVNVYRGLDRLLTDATGSNVMAGGSQRVDTRWGRSLVRQTKGQIVDGVLTTTPIDEFVMPWQNLRVPSIHRIRDMRLELTLREDGASGVLAGYADVDTFYKQLIRNDSTHHLSNGQISGISLYKALMRLADAYPDPDSGEATAISTALDVELVQVFIVDDSGSPLTPERTRELLDRSITR